MSKKHKNKKVVSTVPPPIEKDVSVFVYDGLLIHDIQREVWDEAKQGLIFTLENYELRQDEGGAYYVIKKMGEQVAGKLFKLTDQQLTATDWYETENRKREQIINNSKQVTIYTRGA